MDNERTNATKLEPPVIPADRHARAFTLGASMAILLLGAVALWWLKGFERQIADLARVDRNAAVAKALQLIDIVSLSGGIGLVAAGVWLGSLSRRIVQSGRFPPPGIKVIRDTSLRTGARARVAALAIGLAAFLLTLMGTAGMWTFRSVARSLLGG